MVLLLLNFLKYLNQSPGFLFTKYTIVFYYLKISHCFIILFSYEETPYTSSLLSFLTRAIRSHRVTCASHRALLLTDVSLAMRSDEGLIVWMRDIFHQSGLSDLRRTGPQDQIPSCGATLMDPVSPRIES